MQDCGEFQTVDADKERKEMGRIGRFIRLERKRQDMTLSDLGEAAGLTPSLLSRIELGKTLPSLMSLRMISRALNVSMFSMFSSVEVDSQIVRAADRKKIQRSEYSVQFELLAPNVTGYMEPVLISLEPGTASCDSLMTHPADEWIMVLQGKIDAELNGKIYTLNEHDCLYIDGSSVAHRYVNTSESVAQAVVVMSPPGW